MPSSAPETSPIPAADSAIRFAQDTRARHRRRTEKGNAVREADLNEALERIRAAMGPLRSRIGKIPYDKDKSMHESLRSASDRLQRERRRIWKMTYRNDA